MSPKLPLSAATPPEYGPPMRFVSPEIDGFQVFAVVGTNTVSFGISATEAAREDLLGFGVQKFDGVTNKGGYTPGFKVFKSLIPNPKPDTFVSTFRHPVQSLVWDDFTLTAGHPYRFVFHPYRGTPKKLDRSAAPITISIESEPLYGLKHDVFFNRGVASSQAYVNEFGDTPPDKMTPAKRVRALAWLSRDLDDAILRFIGEAVPGDAIRGCFYEFTYRPVIEALQAAIAHGVDVQLVVDMKHNEFTSHDKQKNGTVKDTFNDAFPRVENTEAMDAVGFPPTPPVFTERVARKNAISHNKFMVLLKSGAPTQVWTGSTNLTLGGVHGQANVGHWIRDAATAAKYLEYWTLLHSDPGGRSEDAAALVKTKNADFYTKVATLAPAPSATTVPSGITPLFSPRSGDLPLDLYSALFYGAEELACGTFPFTVDEHFKLGLKENTAAGPLCFILMETPDRPRGTATGNAGPKKPYITLNAKNNVYEAYGAELKTPLGKWVAETNTRELKLNSHVAYMHCKFMLRDPLGADPIVVTGSANFSKASTNDNDENMVVIRGDRRVADIYFTEFNRLFNHYYYRSVTRDTAGTPAGDAAHAATQFLSEDASDWLSKYAPGTLRSKRVERYVGMAF